MIAKIAARLFGMVIFHHTAIIGEIDMGCMVICLRHYKDRTRLFKPKAAFSETPLVRESDNII